jgi:hypothetical protein
MKVGLLHYHLKTGGVRGVLNAQIKALSQDGEFLVLTGDRAGADLPCQVAEIPGLDYDRTEKKGASPEEIADQVMDALNQKWPDGCDLLHIHNPTLAKNRRFLQIIENLQQAGVALFLQIHDFAEDGRPDVYYDEDYPADCHYGVINMRDYNALQAAGLDAAGLHYLPNAVHGFVPAEKNRAQARVLYPVRAIRRKNVGEAILLSLFFINGQRLAFTQPANSPADMAAYRDWVAWTGDQRLPVDFEVGTQESFSTVVQRSASILTTSIAEGFGMAFLEPWIAGKPLRGRRLGKICADFEEKGIRLDGLYDRLDIPLSWFDADAFKSKWCKAVEIVAAGFGLALLRDAIADGFKEITRAGVVDLGLLNEKYQRQALIRLITDAAAKAKLMELNPRLGHLARLSNAAAQIENNRDAVMQYFGMESYRNRLLDIYRRVVNSKVRHRIDKNILLKTFFDLKRFSLLRWSPYEAP